MWLWGPESRFREKFGEFFVMDFDDAWVVSGVGLLGFEVLGVLFDEAVLEVGPVGFGGLADLGPAAEVEDGFIEDGVSEFDTAISAEGFNGFGELRECLHCFRFGVAFDEF